MTKAERQRRAELTLKKLAKYREQIHEAERQLHIAKNTYDVGESVIYDEYYGTHDRDCDYHTCVVAEVSEDGTRLTVKSSSGQVFDALYSFLRPVKRPF